MPADWLARVTPRALIRNENNSEMLWQFRACVAYFLSKSDRDHDDNYAVVLDMWGRGVHKDYDSATDGAVAALVTHMVRKTRMPNDLAVFVAASEATSEIARRLSESEAERFGPLTRGSL